MPIQREDPKPESGSALEPAKELADFAFALLDLVGVMSLKLYEMEADLPMFSPHIGTARSMKKKLGDLSRVALARLRTVRDQQEGR